MTPNKTNGFKGRAHLLLPRTMNGDEFNFLTELETLIERLPSLLKELREYEKDSPVSDKRAFVTESQINFVNIISSELADFSAPLEEAQLLALDKLLCFVYKLGELKGSHNQWVIDEPYVADAEKSTYTKSKTAKKNQWTANGYQKLTAADIAQHFYNDPENSTIQVGQLCEMVIELFEENSKPTISKEKLAAFLKKNLIIPPEATKKGRPSSLTKKFKTTFKLDYATYLDNDYKEKILLKFK
ncbi:hypothetical protein [Vibrio ouci]|uniref:Uncharacterized protein n=1 Tax=Vibrio ouci TaxID=2499078 RepID=A0A4Y8WCH7_9VIBR|nr:hypothetical protein [Vibrio ouci]TFH89991.1 hypothetical protein ELS82_19305 [Vibrio ouci]